MTFNTKLTKFGQMAKNELKGYKFKSDKPFTKALKAAESESFTFRTRNSLVWFRKYAESHFGRIQNYQDVRNTKETKARFRIRLGYIYTFVYNAKYKDTLPYFDTTPLIVPYKDEGNTFLAYNLHYLPMTLRARAMDELFKINNMKGMTDNAKELKAYGLLYEMSDSPLFKPCIKRYLKSHVHSRFLEFKPEHWEIAIFLPNANFYGATEARVHNDSRRTIMKRNR